jgi:hypothetical protein
MGYWFLLSENRILVEEIFFIFSKKTGFRSNFIGKKVGVELAFKDCPAKGFL